MTPRDALIVEWHKAQVALAQAKEAESMLRAQVIAEVFAPKPLTEGYHVLNLGNGYQLKANFRVNRKFTLDTDDLIDFLNRFQSTSAEAFDIGEKLVKWKGTLSMSTYNALPLHYRQIFDAIIVANDGTPALELITPE